MWNMRKNLILSPFPKKIVQIELPQRYKVSKFTKFSSEPGESTIEHVARHQINK